MGLRKTITWWLRCIIEALAADDVADENLRYKKPKVQSISAFAFERRKSGVDPTDYPM